MSGEHGRILRTLALSSFLFCLTILTAIKARSMLIPVEEKPNENVRNLQLDDYLDGVLQAEMPRSWPMEALKAQAVAARSYTLFQMTIRHRRYLHGSVMDQAVNWKAVTTPDPRIRQAIQETAGQVLMQGTHVMNSLYFADCGGDDWDGDHPSPYKHWTLRVPWSQLRIRLDHGAGFMPKLTSAHVIAREDHGYVGLFELDAGLGLQFLFSGPEFREKMGFQKLKSTLFEVHQDKQGVEFIGHGYGHGQGLCQWGARFWATKGWNYKKILQHYYPAARLSFGHVTAL